MDTDRDWDIIRLEVDIANRKLIEEYYKQKMGKRAQRMPDAGKATDNAERPEAPDATGY